VTTQHIGAAVELLVRYPLLKLGIDSATAPDAEPVGVFGTSASRLPECPLRTVPTLFSRQSCGVVVSGGTQALPCQRRFRRHAVRVMGGDMRHIDSVN
jgi:hypothetical protein